MAEVTSLKTMLDLYGVGVRAGVITPTIEDEEEFRRRIGLPELSEAAKADWASTDGVRKPITLAGVNDGGAQITTPSEDVDE